GGKRTTRKWYREKYPRTAIPRTMMFKSGQRVIRRSMSDAAHRKTRAKLEAKNSARDVTSSLWKSEVIVRTSRRNSSVKRSAAKTLVHGTSGVPLIDCAVGPEVVSRTVPAAITAVPSGETLNRAPSRDGS